MLRRSSPCHAVVFLADANGDGLTGEAANIQLYTSLDGAASALYSAGAAPTEVDSTNFPGIYVWDKALTSTLTDGESIALIPKYTGATSGAQFVPAVQHLQITEDWEEDIFGSGFLTATDSLEAIRDYIDLTIIPAVQRGITVTELSGTGWLSRVTKAARRWADEPSLSSKFQPDIMLELLKESIRELFMEALAVGDKQVAVRHSITFVTDQQDYILPPGVGQVLAIQKIDSNTGRPITEILPSTVWDPGYTGWTLEGNILRLNAKFTFDSSDIYEIIYLPSGDIAPHVASLADVSTAINAAGDEVTLPSTVTDGFLDTRPNAYAGYLFRVVSTSLAAGNVQQEIPITSYDPVTRLATLRRPLNPKPASGTMIYEVIPEFGQLFEDVLALHIARSMLSSIGNKKRFDLISQRYREKARAMRFFFGKAQLRTAKRYDNRTYENSDFGVFWRLV